MPRYEYKVVPAPTKGLKGKGVRGAEARFSHAIQELMNGLAGYGWEYQRAETLPSIERAGLTSTTTEWRNVLVFRRLRENDAEAFSPELLPPPETAPQPPEAAPDVPATEPDATAAETGTMTDEPPAAAPEKQVKSLAENWEADTENGDDSGGISSTIHKFAKDRKDAKPEG